MPVTPLGSDVFGGGRAILFISDLTKSQTSNATLLRLIFGLTAAEARLMVALCESNDLDDVAVSFGVSRETVRTQLRAVFAKAGCRRQAELVTLVARIKIPAPNYSISPVWGMRNS